MLHDPQTSTRYKTARPLPQVSFEFFPPKTPEMEKTLRASIARLAPIAPNFVSVTYGADGTTRDRTHKVIEHILNETTLIPAAHLTCADASRDVVDDVIRSYWDIGVRHVVALRGDPSGGVGSRYQPHPDGYATSADLVAGLKSIGDFDVTVSAYPEKHPESDSFHVDLDILQAKIDNGANRAITQFFFSNDAYFRYLDKVRARGINIPIVPGLIPIIDFAQTARFAKRCGTSVPPSLFARFEGLENDPNIQRLVAAAVAVEQVNALLEQGVDCFHFYTLNRANLVYAICRMLGLGLTQAPASSEVLTDA